MEPHSEPNSKMSWRRVEEVLDLVLDLPPDQRLQAAAEHCGDDADLLAEVGKWLNAVDESSGFLADPVAEALPEFVAQADARQEQQRVGAYRIDRLLGRGGMGRVYLAYRADGQFEHQVAIKMMRREVSQPGLIERFKRERQILAHLDHPHIARLLDGGITDGGVPYLVMEYVEGQPIDVYCHQRQLDVEARLALFLDVCEAVEHAHRRLVIHRDLKPSNILVDADGRVKLLDFGVAKLLDVPDGSQLAAPAVGATVLVTPDTVLVTPDYGAPEQFVGAGLSTATDVYMLGVVLFELLAGQRWRRFGSHSPDTWVRRVAEEEAPRMSDSASDPTHARRLRGDLDAIVARCLRPEPEARYGGARHLADELRRHLGHEPVQARQGRLSYLAGRFLRRHRLAVGAAILLLLSLMAGLVTTFYQGDLARRQRHKAEVAAARAQRVSDFLVDLFDGWDPYRFQNRRVSARDLLDLGAERARSDLQSDPDAQAELMVTLGQVYTRLGLLAEAEPLLQEGFELRNQQPETALLDQVRATIGLGRWLNEQGDPAAAEALLTPALERLDWARRAELSAHAARLWIVLLGQAGDAYRAQGDFASAEGVYQQALELSRHFSLRDHEASCLANLAAVIHGGKRYDEELLRGAIAIYRSADVDEPEEFRATQNNLAIQLIGSGKWDEAEQILRQLWSEDLETLGADHPIVGRRLINLSKLLIEKGDFAEALALADRAEGILAVIGFEESSLPRLAAAMNRGQALTELGEVERARSTMDRARGHFVAEFGVEHPLLPSVDVRRAAALSRGGQHRAAADLYRLCLDRLPEDHVRRADAELGYGAALLALGQPREAEPWLSSAARALSDHLPETAWRGRRARRLLADCQR